MEIFSLQRIVRDSTYGMHFVGALTDVLRTPIRKHATSKIERSTLHSYEETIDVRRFQLRSSTILLRSTRSLR